MGVTLSCDGCSTAIPMATTPEGRIAKVYYCPTCRSTWEEIAGRIEAERLRSVEAFTTARAAILTEARTTLGRLPDE